MPRRRLYTLSIPTDAQLETGRQVRRRTASISPLGDGTAVGQAIAPEPGSLRLVGSYRGALADVMAREVEELADADGYEAVPLFTTGGDNTDRDGYYVVQEADTGAAAPRAEGALHTFSSRLELSGSRNSHFRSVEITVDSVANDFGTTEEARIGAPSQASLVRWYDERANTLTQATPADTVTTEFGAVDLYDVASAPSTTSAALVYDLPYADQGKTDVRVWDDRDKGLAAKTDAEGVVQWARVFVTSHEYQGRPVVSNGRLRVLLDEAPAAQPGLQAERWDASSSQWASVTLAPEGNPDGWALVDADLTHIGPAAVEAQLLFRAADGTQAPLNARLSRGADVLLFATPPNAPAATPVSLREVVEPIASERLQTAGESLGLRARSEVRR
jgi:hypothetical protein